MKIKNHRERAPCIVWPAYLSGFEAPSVLWPEIDRYIATLYGGGDKKPQVVIKGDAANWIKAGTNYVGYSHTVIDGYHISQYIRKIAGNGDSTCLYQALRANDRDRFIHEVKQNIGTALIAGNPSRMVINIF